MDMTLRDCLREAVKISLQQDLADLERSDMASILSVDLPEDKIKELSRKMLFLPHEGVVLMLSKYCFEFSPADTEQLYGFENAKGRFRYYRRLLSDCMGLRKNEQISDASLESACKIVMDDYLRNEMGDADETSKVVPFKGKHAFRTIRRTLAIAALVAALMFTMLMAASADFRERVIAWLVETYEKYSVFDMSGEDNKPSANPRNYTFSYLPEGAELVDSFNEADFTYYEYEVNGSQSIKIMVCTANKKIYVNSEGAEIHPLQLGELEGYWFAKDSLRYVCFERDGEYYSIYGTADVEELWKVASNIEKNN